MRTKGLNQDLFKKDLMNVYFLLGQLSGLEYFVDNERVRQELHQLSRMLTDFADLAYGIERNKNVSR